MGGWETLVEATIDAIRVDPSKKEICIEVTCAWGAKERKRIVATGVDDFVVNEMRLSNVVDRVSLVNAKDVKNDDKGVSRRLFFLMRGKEPAPLDLEWAALKEKLERMHDGRLSLLEMEPVYGATVIILAETFILDLIS